MERHITHVILLCLKSVVRGVQAVAPNRYCRIGGLMMKRQAVDQNRLLNFFEKDLE